MTSMFSRSARMTAVHSGRFVCFAAFWPAGRGSPASPTPIEKRGTCQQHRARRIHRAGESRGAIVTHGGMDSGLCRKGSSTPSLGDGRDAHPIIRSVGTGEAVRSDEVRRPRRMTASHPQHRRTHTLLSSPPTTRRRAWRHHRCVGGARRRRTHRSIDRRLVIAMGAGRRRPKFSKVPCAPACRPRSDS